MIMKNYFAKSSVALMVVSAALASCTQDEIVQNDVPTRQILNISKLYKTMYLLVRY